MRSGPPAPIIPAMSPAPTSSKVILIADRRTGSAAATPTPVRRYRLARLRFETRPVRRETDFEHLKRVYD
jgi:hypothetical protein